jgi:hypothetical protein
MQSDLVDPAFTPPEYFKFSDPINTRGNFFGRIQLVKSGVHKIRASAQLLN